MHNLNLIKEFLQNKYENLYVEISFINNAVIRPPCVLIEPLNLTGKEKNSLLKFKINLTAFKTDYKDIVDFELHRQNLINNLKKEDKFMKAFEILSETTTWQIINIDEKECYMASNEFEAYITDISYTNENYLTMNTLKIGGI